MWFIFGQSYILGIPGLTIHYGGPYVTKEEAEAALPRVIAACERENEHGITMRYRVGESKDGHTTSYFGAI